MTRTPMLEAIPHARELESMPVEVKRNTFRYVDEHGGTVYVFHIIQIAYIHGSSVMLNSGGWRSPTTANRINLALTGTKWRLLTKPAGAGWRIENIETGDTRPFHDGMIL